MGTIHHGTVVRMKDVDVRRGAARLLDGFSWRVRRGEHWVVLGPNGAGKSSLLRLVTGALWPSRGRVDVLGERFGRTEIAALRRRIGWTSAALEERLDPGDTALAVVCTGPSGAWSLFGERPEAALRERAAARLARVGCDAVADRPFAALSSGERQRTMLARALAGDPELLLLDEPCAGLDLPGRETFLATLQRLMNASNAPTVAMTTHHVEEIAAGFTHALLMRDGRATAAGPIASTLTDQALSTLFRMPILLDRRDGRYSARAAASPADPVRTP